ncbi:lysozyme inhibitor LprI family protein [Serratia marcescens]|uniref:lysozyme inhibitor LprI family protein n=1 Tax=Serratia marcescens TaxID=615 RepID=UPI0021BDD98D|nr:lysozyme inhibitor LprI family protein [Serratia marcescens]
MNKCVRLSGRYTLLLIVFLFCNLAQAASFNCNLAKHADERAICADPHLSELDVRLATTYRLLQQQLLMGARGALQDEQNAWLRQRRHCKTDQYCLAQQYSQRQQELDALYRQHIQPE